MTLTVPKKKKQKNYLTPGDVSKLLEVAPRTVAKWCDSGKLNHFRLPTTALSNDNGDRRIRHDDLVVFLRNHKFDDRLIRQLAPIAILASTDTRLKDEVGKHIAIAPCNDFIDIGIEMRIPWNAAIVDCTIGEAAQCADAVSRLAQYGAPVLYIVGEDSQLTTTTMYDVIQRPITTEQLVAWLKSKGGRSNGVAS